MDKSVFASRLHAAQTRMTASASRVAKAIGFPALDWSAGKTDAAVITQIAQMADLLDAVEALLTSQPPKRAKKDAGE